MSSGSHVGSIDLLKFLLAVIIVILHCGQSFGGDSYFLPMGGIAVEAFFIISGCLMCSSAERDAGRQGKSVPDRAGDLIHEGGSDDPSSSTGLLHSQQSGVRIGEFAKANSPCGAFADAAAPEECPEKASLGEDTVRFLWKKVRAILLPYLITVGVYLVCWYQDSGAELLSSEGMTSFLLRVLNFVPNLLLLSMAGILQDRSLMNITWYISAMLIVMLVTYPLVRRFSHNYTLIAAPFLSLLLLGYMYNTGSIYKGTTNFLGIMTQGLMRAFIAVNLGCVAYEMAGKLRKLDLTRLSRILLSLAAVVLLAAALLVMQHGEERDCYALVLLYPLLIAILFSRQMAGNFLFNNALTAWLGRASTCIYLYHVAVRRILLLEQAELSYGEAVAVILTGAMLLFVVTDLVECGIRRLNERHPVRLSSLFVRRKQ